MPVASNITDVLRWGKKKKEEKKLYINSASRALSININIYCFFVGRKERGGTVHKVVIVEVD